MITLHFDLQPQYTYELFHIYFTWFHCTGKYELNKLTLLPMCGFIAQLVEHRTGIAEVMGSNPVEALICFSGFFFPFNCFNWKIYCVITLHFYLQPQYTYELFHIYFTEQRLTTFSKFQRNVTQTDSNRAQLFTSQSAFFYCFIFSILLVHPYSFPFLLR